VRGPDAGADLDVRGPEWSYDGEPPGLRRAQRRGQRPRPVDDRGADLPAPDQRQRPHGRAGARAQLRSGVRPRRQRGVRLDAAGTLTLKNFLPNADLYRVGPDLDFANPERMTWLLNSELSPAFMQNGQLSFTAEKATADFYQLSGRRINWDLTDYHPLLAQRAQSDDTFGKTHPSVAYQRATEIRRGWIATSSSSCPIPTASAPVARWPPSTARWAPSRRAAATSPTCARC
jgi:hypothetical protein